MTNHLVRANDPAAALDPSPTSRVAQAMLRDVLATPRVADRAPRVRWRQLAAGTVAAGAAAAAAFTLAAPADHPGRVRPAGYTVDRRADGSVKVTVEFAEFKDPAALERALEAKGVRSSVLSEEVRDSPVSTRANSVFHDPRRPQRACAKFTLYSNPRDGEPVVFGGGSRFDESTLTLRPDLVPANGTFLIEIGTHGGRVMMIGAGVVVGPPPTCF